MHACIFHHCSPASPLIFWGGFLNLLQGNSLLNQTKFLDSEQSSGDQVFTLRLVGKRKVTEVYLFS